MHTRIDDAYHLPSAIRSRAYIDSPSIAREFFVLLDSEARACPGQSSAMHSVRMIAHVRMLQPAIDRAEPGFEINRTVTGGRSTEIELAGVITAI